MFRIQTMQPHDYSFAVELANTMEWSMAKEDFAFNKTLEPDGCFTLYNGAERVGVATCIRYGSVGWFGNLIVQPALRGKGAGTELVKHAVAYLKRAGVETVGLYAYKHLVDFYNKIGFFPNGEFSVLKAKEIFPVNAKKVQAANKRDFSAILNLDKGCFGGSRQKLLKPQLESGNPCFVNFQDNKVVGYAAARVYGSFAEVGPLVCKRNSQESAQDLLRAVLSKLQGFEGWLVAPKAETTLLQVALDAGFAVEFDVVRMFLGSPCTQDCVYIAESLERG
jgi:GNAT superfamily N-acetyltransferase